MKLPKKLVSLIDAFDEAAKSHGWESDQGSELGAIEAAQEWVDARDALDRYLKRLLSRVSKKGA